MKRHRAHGARKGKTPMDRYFQKRRATPFRDRVEANYDHREGGSPIHIVDSEFHRTRMMTKGKGGTLLTLVREYSDDAAVPGI